MWSLDNLLHGNHLAGLTKRRNRFMLQHFLAAAAAAHHVCAEHISAVFQLSYEDFTEQTGEDLFRSIHVALHASKCGHASALCT